MHKRIINNSAKRNEWAKDDDVRQLWERSLGISMSPQARKSKRKKSELKFPEIQSLVYFFSFENWEVFTLPHFLFLHLLAGHLWYDKGQSLLKILSGYVRRNPDVRERRVLHSRVSLNSRQSLALQFLSCCWNVKCVSGIFFRGFSSRMSHIRSQQMRVKKKFLVMIDVKSRAA